ncbi:hypothetical protein HPB50_004684 [Hyalomma asiaticum]|uniref:Uncharacterized protein n=1 Tax=Hyalomma asiaticum TaxID=266040 RepID=A0ACB7SVA4_HYAAI|nr:hypothetical protein HPB50_004684 [Hyalomma asiaticum]
MGSLEHLTIALTILVASGMRSYAEAAAVPDEQGAARALNAKAKDFQDGTLSTKTLKWFPAHMGELNRQKPEIPDNLNERAHRVARRLTHRDTFRATDTNGVFRGRQDGQRSTASNGRGTNSSFGFLGGVVRDTQGNAEKVYNFVYGNADSVQQVARLYALMSIPVFQQQPTTRTKPATTTTTVTSASTTSSLTTTTTRTTTPPSTIANTSQETGTASTETGGSSEVFSRSSSPTSTTETPHETASTPVESSATVANTEAADWTTIKMPGASKTTYTDALITVTSTESHATDAFVTDGRETKSEETEDWSLSTITTGEDAHSASTESLPTVSPRTTESGQEWTPTVDPSGGTTLISKESSTAVTESTSEVLGTESTTMSPRKYSAEPLSTTTELVSWNERPSSRYPNLPYMPNPMRLPTGLDDFMGRIGAPKTTRRPWNLPSLSRPIHPKPLL